MDVTVMLNAEGRIVWISKLFPEYEEAGLTHEAACQTMAWDWTENEKDKAEVKAAIAHVLKYKETFVRDIGPSSYAPAGPAKHWWRVVYHYTGLPGAEICCESRLLPPQLVGITERQREVFSCLGRKMSLAEISNHLHISQSTVENHVKNLRSIFKARNLTELRHIAIRTGF